MRKKTFWQEDIEDITRWREDMNFMFGWQEQYLTSERSERASNSDTRQTKMCSRTDISRSTLR